MDEARARYEGATAAAAEVSAIAEELGWGDTSELLGEFCVEADADDGPLVEAWKTGFGLAMMAAVQAAGRSAVAEANGGGASNWTRPPSPGGFESADPHGIRQLKRYG